MAADTNDDHELLISNSSEEIREGDFEDVTYLVGEDEDDLLLPTMGAKDRGTKGIFNMNKNVYALTFLSAVGGFLFGYDTGVVSGAMLLIEEDPRISPNTFWKELIVSATVGAAWLFALIGGPTTHHFGRKPTILMASLIFTAGAVVMGVSTSKEVLLVGRLIVGAGIGFASMTVPMYISESSPPQARGLLVSCNILVVTFGQFVASCVCGVFANNKENGWKFMLGLAGIPSAIQFVGFLFMPESPRWLVSKGKIEEAARVLRKIRCPDEYPDHELREIQKAVADEQAAMHGVSSIKQAFTSPPVRRAILLGCLLQMFQQIAGINTVMYYSAKIISMAGFADNSQAIWMSAGVASVNFLCTFIGLYLVERIGRRPLLLASLAGVVLSLGFLAVGFQLADTNTTGVNIAELPVDMCSQYKDCSSCTFDTLCGYCFMADPTDLATNASCVKMNQVKPDFSNYGRCAQGNLTANGLTFASDYCPSNNAWLIVLGLASYLFFFAPGMGPMPWTINSEIYPLWARSLGNSLATSTNWAFNLLISMTFLSLTEAITKQGAFYLYTGVAILGWLLFYWILPETKGTSLEDVEVLFSDPPSIPCTRRKRRAGSSDNFVT